MSKIAKSLSNKTIAITGSTGFLGTALVEKLLRSVPDCHLLLLVRPGRRGAKKRIETEILNNDAFKVLREELGSEKFLDMVEKRITAIPADITQENLGLDFNNPDLQPEMSSFLKTDIFIHAAAAVSFTSPFDMAIDTNLLGPIRLVETLQAQNMKPHLIAVSTAYVAGNRQGYVAEKLLKENPYTQEIDIDAEISSSKRARTVIEDESRSKKMLDEFDKKAREYLGSPGTSALSKRREQLRRSWVKDQLVEMGKVRATSLGFPDIYGLTKAMAETAVCEKRDDIPITFVRPSIIESALKEPFPGWIRGFRMAEPIIISYARGLLKDFPAKPEGILDVIPVDLVVSAILIQAANQNPPAEPKVVNVASGSLNPFLFENLHDWCHDWFTLNPVYDESNNPISPHRWSYPSRTRVQNQLNRATRALALGESFMRKLPIRGPKAQLAAVLEERRNQLERALGYVELYGMYLECEAIFGIDKLLEDFAELSPEDRENFACDPQIIDWHDYLTRIHLPSVMIQGRVKTQPTKPKEGDNNTGREKRMRKSILSPDRDLAVFDLENTIIASNVVASWGWLATRRLPSSERFKFVVKAFLEAPSLLSMERSGRGDFLKHFYRRFEGARADHLKSDSEEMFSSLLLSRSFPAAIRRIREHRAMGHKTLLITGALDFVVEPLKPLFDEIVCCEMAEVRGRYTGTLTETAPIGELRAEILRNYAKKHELNLQDSVAYADSVSDIPMLEAVGFPVAVNPEVKLASIARRRGWLVENFSKATDPGSRLLPIGPSANTKTN